MPPNLHHPADAGTAGPGFDQGRWHALASATLDEPWQTLPDHVRRSSLGRPWAGLIVWHQVGPLGDLYVPPAPNHTILLRRGSPTGLLQRHGSEVQSTTWRRGEVVVVPAGVPTFWRSTAERDNVHIGLAPGWLQRAGGDAVRLPSCFGRNDPVLAALAQVLLASLDNNTSLRPAFGDNLAAGIALHLLENYAVPIGTARTTAALSTRQLRAVIDAVTGRLEEQWPVARLAALVGLSPFHFSRAFKAAAGATPHAWLGLQRMELAGRLVRGTRQPLAEVAAATGYPSAAHFTQAFRRHWRVTPSEYRRNQ